MAKSFKLKNGHYLDTSGIVHDREILKDKLNNFISRSISGSEMCTKFDNGIMIVTGTSDNIYFNAVGNKQKTIDISKYGFTALLSAMGTIEVPYADSTYCDFVVYVHSKSPSAVNYQVWNRYPANINFYINYIIVGLWK